MVLIKKVILNFFLYSVLVIIVGIIQIFIFWLIFGEGAESDRISDLWYVDLILEYFPLVLVLALLAYKVYCRFRAGEIVSAKANFFVIFLILPLYLLRFQVMNIIT